jgi:hypothetical protein
MIIAFSTFLGSGVLIVLMIGWRAVSMRRYPLVQKPTTKIDAALGKVVGKTKKTVAHINGNFLSHFANFILREVARIIITVADEFRKIGFAFLSLARRNTVLKNKGSVSFYLKNVSHHKNNAREE